MNEDIGSTKSTKDKFGRDVFVGDRVKVLEIDRGLLLTLEGEERQLVESMRGDTLNVIEIDKAGYAIVEKDIRLIDGTVLSQSISLSANEMDKL